MSAAVSHRRVLFFLLGCHHGMVNAHTVSRHMLLEDLSMVVLLSDAAQTPGPFAEQDDDYVRNTNDLTLAGTAGSPGLTQDRTTVTEGVPLSIAITVYDVSNPSPGGVELPNVEVFLWHTDAKGVYSAVADEERNGELTSSQVWCRGIQLTGTDGKATFSTILPGWYPGRAIHYHLRLRFPGATNFAATSQLYISDNDLALYKSVEPYSFNPAPTTPLYADNIFLGLNNPTIQDLLTLKMEGSVDTGFSASVKVGLVAPPGILGTEDPTPTPTTMEPTFAPTPKPDPTPPPTAELVSVARPTFAFEEAPPPTISPSSAPTKADAIIDVSEESTEVVVDPAVVDEESTEGEVVVAVEEESSSVQPLDGTTEAVSNGVVSASRQQYNAGPFSLNRIVVALTALLCVAGAEIIRI